jgi:hypothetical protein
MGHCYVRVGRSAMDPRLERSRMCTAMVIPIPTSGPHAAATSIPEYTARQCRGRRAPGGPILAIRRRQRPGSGGLASPSGRHSTAGATAYPLRRAGPPGVGSPSRDGRVGRESVLRNVDTGERSLSSPYLQSQSRSTCHSITAYVQIQTFSPASDAWRISG